MAPDPARRTPWAGIPLGAYELGTPVGTGGMGEVWAAEHGPTRSRVAIKVLTGFAAKHRLFLSAFRNEIRAFAELDHPSIVKVYDRGEIPQETHDSTRGRLQAGSPYLVMEFVGGGSLQSVLGRLSWWELRQVLTRLLDGLAHAHARGLVHRDIKPENVLVTADRRDVKLTDFGLVHAVERAAPGDREKGLCGTPRYMAPEQCRGEWRDYGPWTDLYGLGCVGWALATGKPPFASVQSHWELVRAHTEEDAPRFKPVHPVPPELEGWLRRLMAKQPQDRFGRASEAMTALARLELPTPSVQQTWPEMEALDADDVVTDPQVAGPDATILLSAADPRYSVFGSGALAARPSLLEPGEEIVTQDSIRVPEDWRNATDELAGAALPMIGSGLALYWLRSIPMVGRNRERDLLWSALRSARADGRAHAVLLRGAAGCGVSRLARWLCERSHEIAGTVAIRALHGREGGADVGLAAALGRHLRVAGLEREQVLARITSLLARDGIDDHEEACALTELFSPLASDSDPARTVVRISSRPERHALIARALARIARRRPLVLWLDDVHDSADSLLFAQHLLGWPATSSAPILVVLTARTEALATRPDAEQVLVDLLRLPTVQRLEVGALDPAATRALVRQLLHLEGDLARQVEDRSRGNPQFAMQLVGDWVDRGILEPGEGGLRVRPGATVEIPDGLHSVWAGRLQRFLEDRSVHDGPALEIAALLGDEVLDEEWWAACDRAAITPSLGLVDALLDECLAACGPDGPEAGWAFVHSMLQESLGRQASEAGRLRDHHRAIAGMLEGRMGAQVVERLGRHLAGSGAEAAAVTPLLHGALERLEADELREAEALLNDHDRMLKNLRVPLDDVRWGRGWLARIHLAAARGDTETFDVLAARAEESAERHGWAEVGIPLTFLQAVRAREQGRPEDAWSQLVLVEMAAEENADRRLLASCIYEQARVAEVRGDRAAAIALHQRCTRLFSELQEGVRAAYSLAALAELHAREGDDAGAEEFLQLASELFNRWGHAPGSARCAEVMGLAARLQGDLPGAIACYRDAAARYRRLGSADAWAAEAALGQLLAWQGEHAEALELLQTSLDWFEPRAAAPRSSAIRAAMLPGLAEAGAWEAFDAIIRPAAVAVETGEMPDEDVGWSIHLGAVGAAEAGFGDRAARAWELARTLLEHHGAVEEAEIVRQVSGQARIE